MRLVLLLPFVLVTYALPTPPRHSPRGINVLEDVLLFDAPAFQDPNTNETLVGLQSFVFLRQIDLTPFSSAVSSALSKVGIDVGDKIAQVLDRTKLLAAIGRSGQEVEVNVDGCSTVATLSKTSALPDLGMALQNVSVGQCSSTAALTGQVKLSVIDTRKLQATIFPSSPDGFGVISDIDDTVKISNTLDTLKLAKATLLDDPEPVAGMPELYASLASTLNSPAFIYVSGSPFQLYPFLQDFIATTYSASRGPILLQNLTLIDPARVIEFITDTGAILDYKLSMIDRIHGMYPQKKFLTVGDSTQKDPETYGEAIRKYGDFIACSWIRRVEGGNNTDERFAAAFAGVPKEKFRIYDDADIPGLKDIDVAGGKC